MRPARRAIAATALGLTTALAVAPPALAHPGHGHHVSVWCRKVDRHPWYQRDHHPARYRWVRHHPGRCNAARHRHHRRRSHHARHHGSRARRIMAAARSRRGAPYVWGATGPRAFDCSGYTRWVYARAGIRLPRTAAAQARHGHRVRHPRRGDLVAWGHPAYHVAIYAGHGTIWSAPRAGKRVKHRPIWRARHYFVREAR